MRADQMLDQGDLDGLAIWKRILRAVDELLAKVTVKSRTIELLTGPEKLTAKQIAERLVEELGAKFSPASVAWYASKLRKEGKEVTIMDARRKA